jgi:hypothetical protein
MIGVLSAGRNSNFMACFLSTLPRPLLSPRA